MQRTGRLPAATVAVAALWAGPAAGFVPPVIDGYIEDRAWLEIARVWDAWDARLPQNHVRFYLAWDERCLYFAADVTDPDVTGIRRHRKDPVWEDDGVEFYIDLGAGTDVRRTPDTFQFGFSAAGGVNWTRGTTGEPPPTFPGHDWPPTWNSTLEWAVRLKKGTTLNMGGDVDTGYVVEARIPWSDFGQPPPFAPGRTIGLCFLGICRPEMDVGPGVPLSTVAGVDFTNNHNPSLWERVPTDWSGPLTVRGLVRPLPAALGCDRPPWKAFAAKENDPQGPWLNRPAWTARLDAMAAAGLNILVLEHPGPFQPLLGPQAAAGPRQFSPAAPPEHAEQLRWLIDAAGSRGIDLCLLTHGLGTQVDAAPESDSRPQNDSTGAAEARAVATALLTAFPRLVLAPWAGTEAQPSQAVLDAVVEAVAASAAHDPAPAASSAEAPTMIAEPTTIPTSAPVQRLAPRLLLHTAGLTPVQVRRVLDTLPDTVLLHDLQGRQWFKPQPDPQAVRFAAAVNNQPPRRARPATVAAVGGPEGALDHLAWGDPQWMRTLTLSLRQHGLAGMLLRCRDDEDVLTVESFGAYAFDAGAAYEPGRWAAALDARYRTGERSEALLEALQAAGLVMPRVLALFHDRSRWYMPQFGVPLICLPELPTLSGFEAARAAPSWMPALDGPGPVGRPADWGERLCGLRDELANTTPTGATRPEEVARDLRRLSDRVTGALVGLREVAALHGPQGAGLAGLCDRLELNAALASHWAARIDAAMAWERFASRRQRAFDCVRTAQTAVQYWRQVVRLAERVRPEPVPCGLLRPVSPPPWTPMMIASSMAAVEGHWRDQLPRFERELDRIREMVASTPDRPELPLWDEMDAWPAKTLAPVERMTFEAQDDRRLQHGEQAVVTDEPGAVLEGTRSLRIDTRSSTDPDWRVVVASDPDLVTIRHGVPHQLSLRYRVLQRDATAGEVFEIGLRPVDGGSAAGDLRRWTAPAGHGGRRFVKVEPLPHDGFVFYMAVRGRQVVTIDEIEIARRPQ